MPYAAVNGQKLYYEDTGEGASVLVFSHGLLMDHTMFAPQAEALKHRYCSIFSECCVADRCGVMKSRQSPAHTGGSPRDSLRWTLSHADAPLAASDRRERIYARSVVELRHFRGSKIGATRRAVPASRTD